MTPAIDPKQEAGPTGGDEHDGRPWEATTGGHDGRPREATTGGHGRPRPGMLGATAGKRTTIY